MFFRFFLCIAFVKFAYSECPNGSFASFTDPTICYYFQSNKTDFMGAEGTCKGLIGHLSSVHNMFENVFLSEKAKSLFTDSTESDFWFGANDLLVPGKWTWTDKTPFDFTDWNKGQPQNVSGSNCGAASMSDGTWIADDCFKIKPFVCIFETSVDATTIALPTTTITPKTNGCSEGWTYFNITGYCYKVIVKSSTWWDAEMHCVTEESHLISIHSWRENIFAADLASSLSSNGCSWGAQTWIGASTLDDNKSYQWTDGTSFDFSDWATGEPDLPGNQNCANIWTGKPCDKWIPVMFYNFECNNKMENFIQWVPLAFEKKMLQSVAECCKMLHPFCQN